MLALHHLASIDVTICFHRSIYFVLYRTNNTVIFVSALVFHLDLEEMILPTLFPSMSSTSAILDSENDVFSRNVYI
jgi:hypothetical protein